MRNLQNIVYVNISILYIIYTNNTNAIFLMLTWLNNTIRDISLLCTGDAANLLI